MLCVASVALAVLPSTAAASEASFEFGINGQFLVAPDAFVPERAWPAHFAAIDRAGIEVVRVPTYWHLIEPLPPIDGTHSYRWSELDSVVAELARHELRMLPMVGYSARWAAAPIHSFAFPPAPEAVPHYAAFASAVVARYGPGGDFWRSRPELPEHPLTAVQIWNEQNMPFWWRPEPDPSAYANLYVAAHEAVASLDPSVDVIVGGMPATGASAFLRAMYEERPDLLGRVDAVGVHPYAPSVTEVVGGLADVRDTLDDLGESGTPISITEVGWPTDGQPAGDFVITDAERTTRLYALATALPYSDCGIDRFVPHTWVTPEVDPFDPQDWFGLLHPNGAPTASAIAYARAIGRVLRDGRPATPNVPHPVFALRLCGRAPLAALGR